MKKWYRSRTLWYNFGSGLVALSVELAPLVDLLGADDQAKWRAALVVALIVGNMILRAITDTRVTT